MQASGIKFGADPGEFFVFDARKQRAQVHYLYIALMYIFQLYQDGKPVGEVISNVALPYTSNIAFSTNGYALFLERKQSKVLGYFFGF